MKKILFTLISLAVFLSTKAQRTDTLKGLRDDTLIFAKIEHEPEFPGGIAKFYYFLSRTIRYPAVAKENNIEGKVWVQMIVEKDGSLSRIQVVRGIGGGCDEEAVRVMKRCPKWNPGTQNGRVVRVYYTVPISFALAD